MDNLPETKKCQTCDDQKSYYVEISIFEELIEVDCEDCKDKKND